MCVSVHNVFMESTNGLHFPDTSIRTGIRVTSRHSTNGMNVYREVQPTRNRNVESRDVTLLILLIIDVILIRV